MSFEPVDRPVAGAEAFKQSSNAALLSQAAILVAAGAKIRKIDSLDESDLRELRVPSGIRPLIKAEEVFMNPDSTRERLVRELGARHFSPNIQDHVQPETIGEIVAILETDPSPQWVAGLFEAGLRHPQELVRVAAAAAYQGFTSERQRAIAILSEGTYSAENLVRDLAAVALAQVDPENSRLSGLESKSMSAGGAQASHTALLVHGTFARNERWWQYSGDFHSCLTTLLPALPRVPAWDAPYAKADRFEWTGGYTAEKRNVAADELVQWANSHGAQGMDVIAHSYGGNVAMLATTKGLNIRELILLSCPVLPDVYFPDFARVSRVASFRVHLDMVLIVDSYSSGGLARFWDKRINENILPLWFDHSLTHSPDVWKNAKFKIPGHP
jgi:pimeloyl-ACP methyl ester carboxylesterase